MHDSAPALLLFAKSPVPGKVKTRLIPALGAVRAAEVAAELTAGSVKLAISAWDGPVWLLSWPDADHELFLELARKTGIHLGVQSAGDLGAKMNDAICRFTANGRAAAIMGCDVPHCPPHQLRLANEALRRGDAVIGPSTDGGYYLIGLQQCQPQVFDGVRWGGPEVLDSTLARLTALAIDPVQLTPVHDVDRYEDVVEISRSLPVFRKWTKKS